MTLVTLCLQYLRFRPFATTLHIVSMAVGMAMVTLLLLFSDYLQHRFLNEAAEIDLVVGAKGSPLQLVLSSIYHLDIPPGNIDYNRAMAIKQNRHVRKVIPLALGDQYRGRRIVGTSSEYLEYFEAEFANGGIWQNPMQVVLGSTVAQETGMVIGSAFSGNHGLVGQEGAHRHDEHPYRVVGILKPTGRIIDRLIVTPVQSVLDIHQSEGKASKAEITALLVFYRTRAAAYGLPRQINTQTPFQAVSPSLAMTRLSSMIGIGQTVLNWIGGGLLLLSLGGVFVGLLSAIQQRKYDLALYRVLGARPSKIFAIVLMQGLFIAVIGSILGVVGGLVGFEVLVTLFLKGEGLNVETLLHKTELLYLWGSVVVISALICLVPAYRAYKIDIRHSLMGGQV
ncbi:ABC transporter permease [Sneathiella sp.]|jgi:putative ABC transport system permease protein|uniref:ABC transporter permease n=1 Tax=Sneathiella sp. TaxID=1964365 RepID=UPI0039E5A36D